MTQPIHNVPELSNEEIITLADQVNDLVAKQHQLQEELNKTQRLINIVRLVSTIHLSTPINIKRHKNGSMHDVVITNVTPTKNQQATTERSASYNYSDRDKDKRIILTLNATDIFMKITCPSEEWAKKISLDFVATGTFPHANKLLCLFKRENKNVSPPAISTADEDDDYYGE